MRNFLFLFLILSSFRVSAWNVETRELLEDYQFPIRTPFLSSMWGTCQTRHHIDGKGPKFRTRKLTTDGLSKTFKYRESVQGKRLAIVIPGIFNDLNAADGKLLSRMMAELDYTVIYLPNSLSLDFIKLGPENIPGHFEREAVSYIHIIKKAITSLKTRGHEFRSIDILGNSHGSFLASVITALSKDYDLDITRLTLFAPPYDFGKALHNLDRYLDELDPIYGRVLYLRSLYSGVHGCMFRNGYQGRDLEENAKAATILLSFHKNMASSMRAVDKMFDFNLVPGRGAGVLSSQYREWKKSIKFINYFSTYNPDALSDFVEGEKSRLDYWFDRIELPQERIRILNAQNDFLNAGVTPPKKVNRVTLRRGGHLGFISLRWFQSFFKAGFR